ncbi:SGNH/GDSL hydrolase family protein [Bacillus cytotoxicus]|uniref:Lipolytic protein G-D-S-L family n=2 Tax=Bacillus cytotoxicus TaxID=580165 RepID=A0AAX2CDV6_9BACI|nr:MULTISPECIES: SGNH/GDSL hydrolase family protein [Bacillus cereus group]ABS21112.1 lipolytic protein G-D-S-L family [Bacillus cytotoxicus NVH 391-98]AWC40855.1 lysophospholipase [Bacillus cytotoxicus]AWC48786.1 lysophospholipase [Bacillus cytotoxicus]AWC51833.1 lysophospholipase [Bacillus cytotoxicus]AWC55962.1 lysophospholipase [Bacillus cytotoxicus]
MKIVCIGDSLTEGLGVEKEKSWPMVLAELGTFEVINRGISGDTTAGMLGRFYHEVINAQATHCIIMGGHNDLWWDMPINMMLGNIYSMVKQSLHHNVTPIIGIPIPLHMEGIDRQSVGEPVAGYQVFQNKQSQFIRDVKHMARENGWNDIDFYRLYMNEREDVNSSYFAKTDGIHPNEDGHRDMAEFVWEEFRKWYPSYLF